MTKRRVTIVEVAQAAGVSPSTVSLVLRGDSSISEPTVKRVQEVMAEIGYVYNRGAASLRANRSRILAVVIHDLTNSVFSEIAVGVDSVSQADGYVQFIAHTGDDVERQRNVISTMREHRIAGLIISPARGTAPSDYEPILKLGIPIVQVGRSVTDAVPSVVSDNYAGAIAAVEYLVGLGHTKIAFLGGLQGTETFAQRVAGYQHAMETAGLDGGPVINAAPSRSGGQEALGALLDLGNPSAALCFNDAVAFGVYDGLRMRSMNPPANMSVVGFDDVADARAALPPLTTVSIEPQALGQAAARLLLELARGEEPASRRITLPVTLKIRASCAEALPVS